MEMDRIGVWSWGLVTEPASEVRNAARAVEEMGFGSLWFPESIGREAFSTASLVLEAAERIVVATGIANIWARDPMAAANGARALGEAHPGRFLLGLGVSHAPSVAGRGAVYRKPLETMGSYLDGMETAAYFGPEPEVPVPVILAALGPRMLQLAAARTAGAHPYFVPVEHTRFAREVLGEGVFLAPEQAIVLDDDPERARSLARNHMTRYLALDNYANNLRRLGWDDRHLGDGGSDDLVDAIVAWGSIEDVVARIEAHFASGADHVSLQVLNAETPGLPLRDLEALAAVLVG
jgi:probable F420-dependent oxidoreductase